MAKRAATQPGTLGPGVRIVVLHGPEEMLKRQKLAELREAMAKEHGDPETFTFDGKTAALADVFDELRSYSLMQSYKLVIVDDADQFVKTHRETMERYAENPVDHATLVLRGGVWNKGKKLDDRIKKAGVIIKCEALTPAQARDELVRRAKAVHGRKLAPAAAALLVDRLGPELMKLDTELAKLSLMVGPGGPIGPELIEQAVGRSNDERAYVVQDAVLEALRTGSPADAIAKARELVEIGGQPDVLVTYFVADLVRKLNIALLARRGGMPDFEISKLLKLWGPRQQAFMGTVRHLDEASAGRLFDQALTADARSKSGFGETMRNLECFCVRLADVDR